MDIKRILKRHCPNIGFMRRCLAELKLRQIKRYSLPHDLVIKGEFDSTGLDIAMDYCKSKWGKEVGRVSKLAKNHYVAAGVEIDESTMIDIIFCYFAYGFMPDEYLSFSFSTRGSEERRQFASNRDLNVISYSINDLVDMELYFDKWRTYQAYSRFYSRDAVGVSSIQDLDSFNAFLDSHPKFVQKNVRLSKGDSVKLVDASTVNDRRSYLAALIAGGPVILEEPIRQSAIMASLNESSVNTVRCIVFKTDEGTEIADCFLKVGRNGSFVDNAGAGGILAGVDKDTGALVTDGRDEFANVFNCHPESRVMFNGFRLPDWSQLVDLVEEISNCECTLPYVGWDLAHTENGWIVVEGNASGQFIGPQIVSQMGSRDRMIAYARRTEGVVPIEF